MNIRDTYDVASDIEIDKLLSELPIELLQENIREQINDPLSSSTNYIEVVVDRIIVMKDQYDNMPDVLNQLTQIQYDFCYYILDNIQTRFGIVLWFDDLEPYQLLEMTKVIYCQLILQFSNNIINYLLSNVIANKTNLGDYVNERDREKESKDVTSIGARKQIKNRVDAAIVANIFTVLEHVINEAISSVDTEEMFRCIYNETEASYVYRMLELAADNRIDANLSREYLIIVSREYRSIINNAAHDITQYFKNS